jgi:hypothetical protein
MMEGAQNGLLKNQIETLDWVNIYLWAHSLYGPVRNAFNAANIHYEGKWEGVGPWKLRLFWTLWNGIEPLGESHLGPKKPR